MPSSFLIAVLILHIFFGLLGTVASAAILILLSKGEDHYVRASFSALIAFLSFLIAWIAGGFYYVTFYGAQVKPVIKAGEYVLAHSFVMEAKEHLFLFLPFLALALYLLTRAIKQGAASLLPSARVLAFMTTTIGVLMLLAGFAISGAYESSL